MRRVKIGFYGGDPITRFIAGTFFGSLVSFLFDPVNGKYRRSLIRDKGVRFKHDSALHLRRMGKNLLNITQGVKANLLKFGREDMNVSNEKLVARVRAEFGRKISHTKSIEVTADNGIVTLSGQILKSEVDTLIKCVKKVDGVKEVINNLDAYEKPNKVPGLQGEGAEYLS